MYGYLRIYEGVNRIWWVHLCWMNIHWVCLKRLCDQTSVIIRWYLLIRTSLSTKEALRSVLDWLLRTINSLWPSDIIWGLKRSSVLDRVMACCQITPGHHWISADLSSKLFVAFSGEVFHTKGESEPQHVLSNWNLKLIMHFLGPVISQRLFTHIAGENDGVTRHNARRVPVDGLWLCW